MQLSDAQLLAGSRTDPKQFGVFYDRHADAILRFCVRRTGSLEVAADLTAEVFAAAYAKRGSFRQTEAPARAWLYEIARRQIGTFHRRQRVADRYRRRFGIASLSVSDDLERVEELLDAAQYRAALEQALATIPPDQARAVQLRIVEQLPYEEIARELACSEGAARVRVSRGLSGLADLLEDEDARAERA
ncbi:MAG TPA: RNA polymerase sigma factor [Acidimicrobiia bacterium]|nr:RNA polymerase sigma factor [Acidimicrobiia bacterium]